MNRTVTREEGGVEYRNEYRGHTLNAWTEEASTGRWTWKFTIDDEQLVQRLEEPGTPERAMLEEAIQQARRRIDAYPPAD